MSETTKIEWTNATFNPWWGCEKVSPGCAACYAERDSKRYGFSLWGPDSERRFFGDKHWNEPVRWNKAAQASGQPFRVFCASMADVFEDRRDLNAPRARLFDLIERTPFLTWLLLTKRPENMVKLAPARWRNLWPGNVWAMTTAEDQARYDERVGFLTRVPAKVRGISYEPALGPIDFRFGQQVEGDCYDIGERIHWVICGGESGPKARPMHPDWARGARDQAKANGVAFFFKQWGEYAPVAELDPRVVEEFPDMKRDLGDKPEKPFWMRRVGKKVAGKLLDGREWQEFPL